MLPAPAWHGARTGYATKNDSIKGQSCQYWLGVVCAGAVTGSQAALRWQCPHGRGGSSPLPRTKDA